MSILTHVLIAIFMSFGVYLFISGKIGKTFPGLSAENRPMRMFIFLLILLLLTYPAFFIQEDCFASRLTTSIRQLQEEKAGSLYYEYEQLRDLNEDIQKVKRELQHFSMEDQKNTNPQANDLMGKEKELTNQQAQIEKQQIEKSKNIDQRIDYLSNELENKHYMNLYYAVRALSLGCLGAILTLLVTSAVGRSDSIGVSIFSSPNFYQRLFTDCLAGALVAIIVFALLHTKQITVFDTGTVANNSQAKGEVDYWRLTFASLVAGAFARKIYQAVAQEVDVRLSQQNRQVANGDKDARQDDANKIV